MGRKKNLEAPYMGPSGIGREHSNPRRTVMPWKGFLLYLHVLFMGEEAREGAVGGVCPRSEKGNWREGREREETQTDRKRQEAQPSANTGSNLVMYT